MLILSFCAPGFYRGQFPWFRDISQLFSVFFRSFPDKLESLWDDLSHRFWKLHLFIIFSGTLTPKLIGRRSFGYLSSQIDSFLRFPGSFCNPSFWTPCYFEKKTWCLFSCLTLSDFFCEFKNNVLPNYSWALPPIFIWILIFDPPWPRITLWSMGDICSTSHLRQTLNAVYPSVSASEAVRVLLKRRVKLRTTLCYLIKN